MCVASCFRKSHSCLSRLSSGNALAVDTDDEDNPLHKHWDPQDWIGQNKIYPALNTPASVQTGRRLTLAIPPALQQHLVTPGLSVAELLICELPMQRSALVVAKAEKCSSIAKPSDDLLHVICPHPTPEKQPWPIPPSHFIQALCAAFGQAWFDGSMSIIDPGPGNERSRLPLFTPTYWLNTDFAISKRSLWQGVEEWLHRYGHRAGIKVADGARTAMYGDPCMGCGCTSPRCEHDR